MSTTAQPTDLFGEKVLPPEGVHAVEITALERLTSPTQGSMRRLVGRITRGPHAGCLVYKPLTEDLRGVAWMEQAAIASGVDMRSLPAVVGTRLDHLAEALAAAGELRAVIYHYHHAEGTFPTLRSLMTWPKPR